MKTGFKLFAEAILFTAIVLLFGLLEATVLYYHTPKEWVQYITAFQLVTGFITFFGSMDIKKEKLSEFLMMAGIANILLVILVVSALAQARLQGL